MGSGQKALKSGEDTMSGKKHLFGRPVSLTILCSILAVGINYMISFSLASYITSSLGAEAYGFVSIAKTIANYGIILTTCFNSFSARYITIAYHENNMLKAISFYSTILYINAILVVIAAFLSLLLAANIDKVLVVPTSMRIDVQLLLVCDILNYALLSFANSYSVSAQIKNKLYLVGAIKIVSYLLEALALVMLFGLFSPKVYYVGIALLVSTGVIGISGALVTHRITPELRVDRKSVSFETAKKLFVSGVWNSINGLGNLLNTGLDLWVSNLLLSTQAMGELSFVKTVTTMITSLFQLISQPFQPMLLEKYAARDVEGVVKTLKKQISVNGFVSCLMMTGLYTLGRYYYALWVPGQDSELLYRLTMVSLLGLFFEGMVYPLFYIYTLTLRNRVPCVLTVISGLLNVMSMYIMIKYCDSGLYVIVGTTAVLGILMYLFFTPLYSAKCLKLAIGTFIPSMLKVSVLCGACLLMSKLLFAEIRVTSWFSLLLYGVLITLCSLIIYMMGNVGVPVMKKLLKKE